MRVLLAGIATCLLLAAPMEKVRAQSVRRVTDVAFQTSPKHGDTYRLDEQIGVVVEFPYAMKVTGHPQLGLTVGSQTRQAAYDKIRSASAHRISGTYPGATLIFTYTVQGTDADTDGISIAANALTLNGGTISLAANATLAASLGHDAVGTNATRKVDGSLRLPPDLRHYRAKDPARGGTPYTRDDGDIVGNISQHARNSHRDAPS